MKPLDGLYELPLDFNTEMLTNSCDLALCRSIEIHDGFATLKTKNDSYSVIITIPVEALIPYLMRALCNEIPVPDVLDAVCTWVSYSTIDNGITYIGELQSIVINYDKCIETSYIELHIAGKNYISLTEEVALFYIELLKEKAL